MTLEKTDEICRAAESMAAQMKIVGDISLKLKCLRIRYLHTSDPCKASTIQQIRGNQHVNVGIVDKLMIQLTRNLVQPMARNVKGATRKTTLHPIAGVKYHRIKGQLEL